MTRQPAISLQRGRWQVAIVGFVWQLLGAGMLGFGLADATSLIVPAAIAIVVGVGLWGCQGWASAAATVITATGLSFLIGLTAMACVLWLRQAAELRLAFGGALLSLLLYVQLRLLAGAEFDLAVRESPAPLSIRFRTGALFAWTFVVAVGLASYQRWQHGYLPIQGGSYSFLFQNRRCEVTYAIVAPKRSPHEELLYYAIFHYDDRLPLRPTTNRGGPPGTPYRLDRNSDGFPRAQPLKTTVRFGVQQLEIRRLGTLLEVESDSLQVVTERPGITKDEFQSYLASFPAPMGIESLLQFVASSRAKRRAQTTRRSEVPVPGTPSERRAP